MSVDIQQENTGTTKRDPELTRSRLLDAATKLFAEKGRDGTSVDEICQVSGVNCRMIYHYFGSKEGLYMAMLESVYGRIHEITTEIDEHAETLAEFVDTLTERYFRFLQANPEFVAILRWENASGAEGIRQMDMESFRSHSVGGAHRALELKRGPNSFMQKNPGSLEENSRLMILTCVAVCGYFFSNQASLGHVLGADLTSDEFAEHWLKHIKRLVLSYYCD